MNPPIDSLTLANSDGVKIGALAPPTAVPTDLVPGEFIQIPEPNGARPWYVYADKQRFWSGTAWVTSGTLVQFDPGTMTEAEMYELRHKLLRFFGWI